MNFKPSAVWGLYEGRTPNLSMGDDFFDEIEMKPPSARCFWGSSGFEIHPIHSANRGDRLFDPMFSWFPRALKKQGIFLAVFRQKYFAEI